MNSIAARLSPLSLVFLFIFFACSQESGNIEETNLNRPGIIRVTKNLVNFDEQLKELKVIKLESQEENLIGTIDKIVVNRSGIFILDIRNTKSLYHFDAGGRFKYKLSEVGTGPSEFYMPFDFSVNEADGMVYILDIRQRKILKYDLESGIHIGNSSIDFQTKSFAYLNNEQFAFQLDGREFSNDKKEELLIIYDLEEQKTLSSYLPEYATSDYMLSRTYFTHNDNELLYSKSMHDTIYHYTNETFEPKYILDFQGRNIPDAVKSLDMMEARQSLMEGGFYYHNGGFSKVGDKLLFNWLADEEKEYLGYYNFTRQSFINFDFSEMPFKTSFGSYDSFFVSFAYSYDFPPASEYYLADDEQNPYVLLFKLK